MLHYMWYLITVCCVNTLTSVHEADVSLYQPTMWSPSHLVFFAPPAEKQSNNSALIQYALYGCFTSFKSKWLQWLYKHTFATVVPLVPSGMPRCSAVLSCIGGFAVLPVRAEVMQGLSLSRLASRMNPVCSGSSTLNSSVICEHRRRCWGIRGWVPSCLFNKCRKSARVMPLQPFPSRKKEVLWAFQFSLSRCCFFTRTPLYVTHCRHTYRCYHGQNGQHRVL